MGRHKPNCRHGAPFFRRRKSDPLSGADAPQDRLQGTFGCFSGTFSERGKIVPSRITAVLREKSSESLRARSSERGFLGLLPYVIK